MHDNRPHLLSWETIANARDQRRVYNDGGALPGCALEIHVRNGGKSKRAYFRYPGKPFGEPPVARAPLGDVANGLSELRRRRVACEQLLEQGKSPKAHRKGEQAKQAERAQLSQRTVGDALEEYCVYAGEHVWKVPHHRLLMAGIKKNHLANTALMKKPLQQATWQDIYEVVAPFWHGKYVSKFLRVSHKANGAGIGVKMRSLLHSTFEREIDYGRYAGRNPCSWKKNSPLSKELRNKPISIPRAAPELPDLKHIVAHIRDPNRNRIPGHITTAELMTCTGWTDNGILRRRKLGMLHGVKPPNRMHTTASYMFSIVEARQLCKQEGKEFKELQVPRECYDTEMIGDLVLATLITAVRPSMMTYLRWRNIKDGEFQRIGGIGYIEYLPTIGDRLSEHKTGYDGVSPYIVVMTDTLRAIFERARQRHIRDGIEIKPDGYVFVHARTHGGIEHFFRKPLSPNRSNLALQQFAKELDAVKKKDIVISGVRSTIAHWATGKRYHPDVVNLTLGHSTEAVRQNKTNTHYLWDILHNPDLLEARHEMMIQWEQELLSPAASPRTGKVVPLRRSASA